MPIKLVKRIEKISEKVLSKVRTDDIRIKITHSEKTGSVYVRVFLFAYPFGTFKTTLRFSDHFSSKNINTHIISKGISNKLIERKLKKAIKIVKRKLLHKQLGSIDK